jgi:dihydroneopterin aldolase
MASDLIRVRGLRIVASVGVLPEEHERLQPLILDLDVEVDLSEAGATDDLDATVNYAAITQAAVEVVTSRHHELLEAIGDEVARAALAIDRRISAIEVSVTKVRPPIGLDVDTVGIVRRVGR